MKKNNVKNRKHRSEASTNILVEWLAVTQHERLNTWKRIYIIWMRLVFFFTLTWYSTNMYLDEPLFLISFYLIYILHVVNSGCFIWKPYSELVEQLTVDLVFLWMGFVISRLEVLQSINRGVNKSSVIKTYL